MSTTFKLKPHPMTSEKEVAFLRRFEDMREKNVLAMAFTDGGVTVEEMEALGIGKNGELSRKDEAALFARYQYKCSHEIAKRIMEQNFDDNQLDTVMSVLLLPTFCIPEEKLLDEILYDTNSMEEMVEWLNKNRII
ncbi:MAG: hypothetical protein IKL68_02300 [Clostridia bacterium]|nr:hypothetical protein [Clostridia bacterium]